MIKNKKIFVLNIVVLVAIIASVIIVLSGSGHYTLHTNSFTMDNDVKPSVKVSFDKEGVVELKDYYMKNNELILEFDAVGKGEVNVSITHMFHKDVGYIREAERTFSVGLFNVIIDKTENRINFDGYLNAVFIAVGILVLSWIIMLWMFVDYRRKGDFCYQMIASGGVSIYFLILSAFLIYKLVNNGIDSFSTFLFYLSDIGLYLLLAITPIMFVLSILLSFSNIWLMRHEGRRPVNALGIAFGVLWFIGTALTLGGFTTWFLNVWDFPFGSVVRNVLVYIICYFECMFLSTVVCSYLSTRYTPAYDRDYIIILGCCINKDGTLTPLLRGRADAAISFEKAQAEATGKHAVFVPSGGQGDDEVISESEAMSRYLMEQGVPETQILKEDKSVNTFENMKLSRKVIESNGDEIEKKKIAFATTNYHVFRGYVLANKNGFAAKGISAKTKFYFYPNAFLREFIGLLVEQKWKHLTAIVLISIFFVGLRFLF